VTDLSTWYTKAQACAKLGNISERTLDRMVARGHVRKRGRPMAGRKPEPVYSPDDVEKIVETQASDTVLMSTESNYPVLRRKPASVTPQPAPLWLTYTEAVTYCGLPRGTLKRLVRDGKVLAMRAGATRLCRADLDVLSRRQSDPSVHVAALLPLLRALAEIARTSPPQAIGTISSL
jgi:hypothetical protein